MDPKVREQFEAALKDYNERVEKGLANKPYRFQQLGYFSYVVKKGNLFYINGHEDDIVSVNLKHNIRSWIEQVIDYLDKHDILFTFDDVQRGVWSAIFDEKTRQLLAEYKVKEDLGA